MEITRDFCLNAAHTLLTQSNFDKASVAKVNCFLKLADSADGGQPNQRSNRILYNSTEERDAWLDYLRSGRYTKRDMTSGGSGLGSTSPLVPLQFLARVTHTLKLVDEVLDPDASTVIRTPTGSPLALPMDFDVNAAATVVNENQQGTSTDPVMGAVFLPQSPTWRTSIYGSVEFAQDSGIPLDLFLATILAVRFARGFGASLVSALLAAAATTVTAAGAAASGQAGPSTALGSDDLAKLMQSLDGSYLRRASWAMQPATYSALLGLRGLGSGNLVFHETTDAAGNPTLLGKRVLFTPSMPPLGGGHSVVLGDFSRLVVRMGSSMTLQASAERRPESGSIFYWSTWRLQGAVAVDPNLPAGTDKPFVTFSGAIAAAETERSQPPAKAEGSHHGRTQRT